MSANARITALQLVNLNGEDRRIRAGRPRSAGRQERAQLQS